MNIHNHDYNVEHYLRTLSRRLENPYQYGKSRLLLDHLSSQTSQVAYEIAAITIQKAYRRRLGYKYMITLRNERQQQFVLRKERDDVINALPTFLADEICVQLCVQIAMECHAEYSKSNTYEHLLALDIQYCMSQLLMEIVYENILKIVPDCIRELTALHLKKR